MNPFEILPFWPFKTLRQLRRDNYRLEHQLSSAQRALDEHRRFRDDLNNTYAEMKGKYDALVVRDQLMTAELGNLRAKLAEAEKNDKRDTKGRYAGAKGK